MVDYVLKRSNRKTLAIYVREDGAVEVRAPLTYPLADIEKFVESKEKWIEKHSSNRKEIAEKKKDFRLYFGERLLLLGKEYPLIPTKESKVGFNGKSFFAYEKTGPESLKRHITELYKAVAKKHICEKTAKFASLMKVSPCDVKINSAKTHWGSCSGKNSLNFSWKLIMADEEAVDYVIVHELAHIKQHNHSEKFWKEVEKIIPDYKERKEKLKELQRVLSEQDWES